MRTHPLPHERRIPTTRDILLGRPASLALVLALLAPSVALADPAPEYFVVTENAAVPGHNIEILDNRTPEECAEACLAEYADWCVSFDYDTDKDDCFLQDVRGEDVGGLTTHSQYDHYSLFNRHVLLIGVDGLRGDAIMPDSSRINCEVEQMPGRYPALEGLIAGGAFHDEVQTGGVSENPQSTYSGPGWASVFTGYWADEHGITSNSSSLVMQEDHIFDLIEDEYPWASSAVVGDWVNITTNLAPDGMDESYKNPYKNSREATDTVVGWLEETHAHTAIFYYLHNVDIHADAYDPCDQDYADQIVAEDAMIQEVLDALDARLEDHKEDWLIVVASDHGGRGTGHGGQSASERRAFMILNNEYSTTDTPYCTGTFSKPMLQTGGVAPHIADFMGLENATFDGDPMLCDTVGARTFTVTTTTSTQTYSDTDSPLYAQFVLSDGMLTEPVRLDGPDDDFEMGDENTFVISMDGAPFSGREMLGLRLEIRGNDGWRPSEITVAENGNTVFDYSSETQLIDGNCSSSQNCDDQLTVDPDGEVQRVFQLVLETDDDDASYGATTGVPEARVLFDDDTDTGWIALDKLRGDFGFGQVDTYTFSMDESGADVESLELRNTDSDGWLATRIALYSDVHQGMLIFWDEDPVLIDAACGPTVHCAEVVTVDTSGTMSEL